jgi:threonine/homoserine/homoserine lactone efflux protein
VALTLEQLVAFVGFSIVVAGTPGPSNAILASTGANVGVIRGLPALAGVAAGMALLMFVVSFGLGALILENPMLVVLIKVTGAGVLLWLAWKIATSDSTSIAHRVRPIGLLGAAAFQWVNPKSWLACTSAAAAFVDQTRGSPPVHAATLAIIFALTALPCCLVWLAFGAVIQRTLRSERAVRSFNIAMAALLTISVGLLLT